MVVAREHGRHAMRGTGGEDAFVIGCDHAPRGAAAAGALCHAHDHGKPCNVGQGLPGRRLEDRRAGIRTVKGAEDMVRAGVRRRRGAAQVMGKISPRSRRRPACGPRFPAARECRRAPVGQARAARDQFLVLAVKAQRAFGDGADQQFEKFGVHGGSCVLKGKGGPWQPAETEMIVRRGRGAVPAAAHPAAPRNPPAAAIAAQPPRPGDGCATA